MSATTTIEWTDKTWNPLRGCSRVSPGCVNCYAESIAYRFSGRGGAYEGLVHLTGAWNGKIRLVDEALVEPLTWRRPAKVFVNSMSDLFHENTPDEFIAAVFGIMAAAPHHTFQVLTKRAERMVSWLKRAGDRPRSLMHECVKKYMGYDHPRRPAVSTDAWPLPNVWLGISAEDQPRFDERWSWLAGEQFAGWNLFLSAEPLLSAIDIGAALPNPLWNDLPSWRGGQVRWVICGGESGRKARPMHPDWARYLRDQCVSADTPYLFKQWGEWIAPDQALPGVMSAHHDYIGDQYVMRVGKGRAGRLLDGRTWDQFPDSNTPRSEL